ncbi:hypothetical protein Ddye_011785 [Dipteronia dyeriana]|uniref:Uncharacterized protein n=1 Tax=Dipteronia dyeriana TaxID=168575 RepID=A0AAD9X387_9ROSI|nr:hypothetical protein Ddye_011785 [Dipteronia dyeriana]
MQNMKISRFKIHVLELGLFVEDDDFGEDEVIYKTNPEAMPSRTDQEIWKMDRDHEMNLVCSFMLKGFIRCGVMLEGREMDSYFNP